MDWKIFFYSFMKFTLFTKEKILVGIGSFSFLLFFFLTLFTDGIKLQSGLIYMGLSLFPILRILLSGYQRQKEIDRLLP